MFRCLAGSVSLFGQEVEGWGRITICIVDFELAAPRTEKKWSAGFAGGRAATGYALRCPCKAYFGSPPTYESRCGAAARGGGCSRRAHDERDERDEA